MDLLPQAFYNRLCTECVGDEYRIPFDETPQSWYQWVCLRTVRECEQSAKAWATLSGVLSACGRRKCEKAFRHFRLHNLPPREVCVGISAQRRVLDTHIDRARVLACFLIDTLFRSPRYCAEIAPMESFIPSFIKVVHLASSQTLTMSVSSQRVWTVSCTLPSNGDVPTFFCVEPGAPEAHRRSAVRFLLHECVLQKVVRTVQAPRRVVVSSLESSEGDDEENHEVEMNPDVILFAPYVSYVRNQINARSFVSFLPSRILDTTIAIGRPQKSQLSGTRHVRSKD